MTQRVTQRLATGLRRSWQDQPVPLDLLFYVVSLSYALGVALTNEFYGYRMWGNFATVGYGLAALHALWLLLAAPTTLRRAGRWASRWLSVAFVGAVGMVLPLGVLVVRRLTGQDWTDTPGSWSAQPEVWVIERSADLLLDNGTPYVDVFALGRPPVVNDYTPYGPVMALFGIPKALFGGTPVTDALTDARLMFVLVAAACVWLTLRLLGGPAVPLRSAQLAVISPVTALTFATAAPDLAILGLLVVACVLAATSRPLAAGAVLALVGSAKLIALLAAPVLAVLLLARMGRRAAAGFGLVLLGGTALLNVGILLVDAGAFVEHVLRFPAGLGAVTSPAASPLPGHLIASTGTAGKVIAFALLGAAALTIGAWLALRPPTTGSDALLRIAIGLGAFTLLTPATRFGYLVYPLVLLGVMVCFRASESTSSERTGTTSF